MKLKYLIITIILFIPQIVFAAPNATASTNASSIEKGKSVTLTVNLTDTAAWNIKMIGSGAGACSSKQADVTSDGKSTTKKFTLVCTATEEGKITFSVTGDITSGTGETKDILLTKQVTVTSPKSSVNTLSSLKVDDVSVSGFSSSKTAYSLPETTKNSIVISGTATDSKAIVSGNGTKTLRYGKNTFNIVVTAENGAKKTYSINISKKDPRNSNNYLQSLTIDKGTIDFKKDTTSYTIRVEHSVNEVNIVAAPEDSKAKVSGTGSKTLKDYVNEFKVIVKAENESTRTYVIKVIRQDESGNFGKLNTDNSVKSITITDYDLEFKKDVKKYNILVEDIENVEFKVVPNNAAATVSITNNTDLQPGLNVVKIQITAENGDINEYIFNVYKIAEADTPPTETKEEKVEPVKVEKEGTNIWLIVSIVEFVIIIILTKLLLSKGKRKKKDNNVNNNINNDVNNDNLDKKKLEIID